MSLIVDASLSSHGTKSVTTVRYTDLKQTDLEVHLFQEFSVVLIAGCHVVGRDDDIQLGCGPQVCSELLSGRLTAIVRESLHVRGKGVELSQPVVERGGRYDDKMWSRMVCSFEVSQEADHLACFAQTWCMGG